MRRAKAALKEFLPVFPDLLNSVKTEIAARYLLHKHRSLVEDAFEAGSINSRCVRMMQSSNHAYTPPPQPKN